MSEAPLNLLSDELQAVTEGLNGVPEQSSRSDETDPITSPDTVRSTRERQSQKGVASVTFLKSRSDVSGCTTVA